MTTGTLFQSVTHQVSYSAVRRGARALVRIDTTSVGRQGAVKETALGNSSFPRGELLIFPPSAVTLRPY